MASVYSTQIQINLADTVKSVGVGRDDLSPFASISVQFAVPPTGFLANTTYQFVFRPMWDAHGFPNIPGMPESTYYQAALEGCDLFSRAATNFSNSTASNRIIHFYIDSSATTSNPHHYEFFKYQVTW